MAVEVYEDGSGGNGDLDSSTACSGGQGAWEQSVLRAGPATILSGEMSCAATEASYLDLTTPFEVGRVEFTVGSAIGAGSAQVGICYIETGGGSRVIVQPDASGNWDLWEISGGSPTNRGYGGIATSASSGHKVALECTESGKVYTQIDTAGSWVDDIGSSGSPSSCATQSGDILLRGNSGSVAGKIDDLYGPAAAAAGGFYARHYYDNFLAGGC